PTLHHVFRDRRLGDLKAEHQQLAMDPRCSPLWVFSAHSSDEIAQFAIDLWPPRPLPRFPNIKSAGEQHERVAGESELTRCDTRPGPYGGGAHCGALRSGPDRLVRPRARPPRFRTI